MAVDSYKNSQFSDEDDETTMELEALSEEACSARILADDSATESSSALEVEGARESRTEAEAPISSENASLIQELQDEVKFRVEMNNILQLGIDQEREKSRRLAEQISGFKKTSEKFSDELKRSRKQATKTKKKLAKAKNREKELLDKLRKLDKPDAANAVIADQDGAIEELRKQNLELTDAISDLEAKLEIARQNTDYLETRMSEASAENAKLLVELESRNAQMDEYSSQFATLRRASRVVEQTLPHRVPEARPMPAGKPEESWVLVGLDDDASGTHHLDDETVIIGSSPDSDIQIQSKFISRHHAQLVKNKNGCVLGDLNSTNGTFVNSRRINKRVLRDGDIVTIGKHRFRYEKQSAKSI
jgi:hypothetical protein